MAFSGRMQCTQTQ